MMPRVSLCLPVYNGGRYLQATLDSILAQDFADFELVVVDNASTDETPDILGRLRDPRLRCQRNQVTVDAAVNWNLAVAMAETDYVKLVCADDLLYPPCLREEVAVLDRHSDVVLVAARRDIVDDAGTVVVSNRGLAGMRGRIDGGEAIRRVARSGTNPLGEPAAVLMRRDALISAGGFRHDIPYMIDADMWCRVLRNGSLFALDRTLCAFRLAAGSWSERLAGEQSRQGRLFVRSLHRDFSDVVTPIDELVGTARATAMGVGRRGLYALLSSRDRWRSVGASAMSWRGSPQR